MLNSNMGEENQNTPCDPLPKTASRIDHIRRKLQTQAWTARIGNERVLAEGAFGFRTRKF